jgi:hypothetical protein
LGADPLFAGAEQVHSLQPNVQRDMAGFRNSANGCGERLATGVALAHAKLGGLAHQAADPVALSVARADRTIRPDSRLNERQRYSLIMKLSGGQDGLVHRNPSGHQGIKAVSFLILSN